MANLLPEDVLTNIFRRFAPRYLAVSRCVCKTWCSIIDTCKLLRADLLPHSVCGIFIQFNELSMSEFFFRPSKGPTISGYFDYLPHIPGIKDHCNGLLLLHNFVVNPATRQWMPLPQYPSKAFGYMNCLVFDPALSPHYEVFLVPHVRSRLRFKMLNYDVKLDPVMEELEWPPSPCILYVFSSMTKEWEERSFIREGKAAGNVSDMQLDWPYVQDNAVYWQGVLYVNCQTKFIMRISVSKSSYQVIKPPVATKRMECTDLYLGQSEKGVYCALYGDPSLWIYILDESNDKKEWVFKRSCHIWPAPSWQGYNKPGPWTLQDINHQGCCNTSEDDNKETVGEKFDWDSDNDNVIDTTNRDKYNSSHGSITFLGFHPYKEVVFLCDTLRRGLAYHLNSSKIQDLGSLHPTHYGTEMCMHTFIERSFPYTPWLGELPDGTN